MQAVREDDGVVRDNLPRGDGRARRDCAVLRIVRVSRRKPNVLRLVMNKHGSKGRRTNLPDNSTAPNPAAHADDRALPDDRTARLNRRAYLDGAVVHYGDRSPAAASPAAPGRERSDMCPLVHYAPLADVDGPGQGLDLGARVNEALGPQLDGVGTRQDGRIGDDEGAGEADGGLWAGLGDGWENGVALRGGHVGWLVVETVRLCVTSRVLWLIDLLIRGRKQHGHGC